MAGGALLIHAGKFCFEFTLFLGAAAVLHIASCVIYCADCAKD